MLSITLVSEALSVLSSEEVLLSVLSELLDSTVVDDDASVEDESVFSFASPHAPKSNAAPTPRPINKLVFFIVILLIMFFCEAVYVVHWHNNNQDVEN
ncbi:hypothetical protein D920_01233 [Enterococcus faecalis 13-SD-W-01]|nr:hypothetical protein D920_01233 [Enterococcus faecalis 13-SD-W-01]